MIAALISESKDECIFRLEDYTEFRTSPEDKRLVLMGSWGVTDSGYIWGVAKPVTHKYLHKLIYCLSGQVDHKDRDPLNNRRDNLRPATPVQNAANISVHSDNRLGIKGVYKHQNKYQAQIQVNGKKIYLGIFSTPEQASEAYRVAAKKHFGEFANT